MTYYVTQGTVQVSIVTVGAFPVSFKINPHQDYAAKHDKKNYIIFMPNSGGINASDAKVFEAPAETHFSVQADIVLLQALIQAAFKRTNIEIEVNINGTDITVNSIKIPATF